VGYLRLSPQGCSGFCRSLLHHIPVEKHIQERLDKPRISPLRYAPVEMTKGRDGASRERVCQTEEGTIRANDGRVRKLARKDR
jgi:hypothetical protein